MPLSAFTVDQDVTSSVIIHDPKQKYIIVIEKNNISIEEVCVLIVNFSIVEGAVDDREVEFWVHAKPLLALEM